MRNLKKYIFVIILSIFFKIKNVNWLNFSIIYIIIAYILSYKAIINIIKF